MLGSMPPSCSPSTSSSSSSSSSPASSPFPLRLPGVTILPFGLVTVGSCWPRALPVPLMSPGVSGDCGDCGDSFRCGFAGVVTCVPSSTMSWRLMIWPVTGMKVQTRNGGMSMAVGGATFETR